MAPDPPPRDPLVGANHVRQAVQIGGRLTRCHGRLGGAVSTSDCASGARHRQQSSRSCPTRPCSAPHRTLGSAADSNRVDGPDSGSCWGSDSGPSDRPGDGPGREGWCDITVSGSLFHERRDSLHSSSVRKTTPGPQISSRSGIAPVVFSIHDAAGMSLQSAVHRLYKTKKQQSVPRRPARPAHSAAGNGTQRSSDSVN